MSGQRRWLGIRMTRRQREVLLPFGGALLAGVLLGLLLASWLVFDSNAYRLFRDAMVLLGSGLLTWFGWRRVKAADQQNRNQTRALDRQTDQIRLTREQMELTRRDQLSKRFTEAVKQLGDDKLEIRMGGIAGLWAVATESTHPEDRIMVLDVLCAFVRNAKPPGEGEPQTVRPDVKLAMDRLGSVGPYFPWGDVEEGHQPYRRDFSGAYLKDAHFLTRNFKYSNFESEFNGKIDFVGCDFFKSNINAINSNFSALGFYFLNAIIQFDEKSLFIGCDFSNSKLKFYGDIDNVGIKNSIFKFDMRPECSDSWHWKKINSSILYQEAPTP